jgi:hypothetical protein
MLNLWGLRLFGYGAVDYQRFGDIATWAQGFGTVGAIMVALRQIRQQDAAWRADITREDKRERTRVYCWLTFRDDVDTVSPGWYLNFNNLTPLPISVWTLRVKDSAAGSEIGVIDVSRFDPIQPGFSRVRVAIPPEVIDQPICELDFVDHAGDCWRRLSTGPLTSIDAIRLNGQTIAVSAAGEDAGL